MLKNHLKTAFRNLKKQLGVSLINIGGLTMAIASCLIIISYITFELSYDNYHKDHDRIYRIALDLNTPSYQNTFARISYFMAPYLE